MRILLVRNKSHELGNVAVSYPLGVMYLAASLTQAGHQVDILDMNVKVCNETVVLQRIHAFKPQWIGFSTLSTAFHSFERIASAIRKIQPALPLVMGGPHPTQYQQEALSSPLVDITCVGEGEETVKELAEHFSQARPLASIKGIGYKRDGRCLFTEYRPFNNTLDALPFPTRTGLAFRAYQKMRRFPHVRRGPYMSVFTSRGCPFRCKFCYNNFGKTYRARSVANVLDELEDIHDTYGIQDIEVVDDIFNFDKQRTWNIFQGILERNLNLRIFFPNGLRADKLDEELIALMKEAGVYFTALALETGSQRLQKLMRKGVHLDKFLHVASLLDRYGIVTKGNIMLGFPTETEEEMRLSIRMAAESRLHLAAFFIVTPFKGSELYEEVKAKTAHFRVDFSDLNVLNGKQGYFNLSEVPDKTLFRLQKQAYRSFYHRPWRLLRILQLYPDKPGLFTHGIASFLKWGVLKKIR